MWQMIVERMPSLLGWFCTLLAFLVPYVTYKINQHLHRTADPPWKREENSSGGSS
ncbi:hypothetical protein [Ornithinibacillus caprae]|uniref:hypothetical protein n=1 Tax=Ornithinibacillus caprae TaxID=2678566 RepID=UPI0018C5BA61|nr:hypothetical protein [Ornithinibacillus caprae]